MDQPIKHKCKCANLRPEFWIALTDLRNQLYESALVDFIGRGFPHGSRHMHELLDCIDDYLEIAFRDGFFAGSE